MIKLLQKRNGNAANLSSAESDELQECRSKLDAISRSQAVIEFELDGTIITANDNFLTALGYRLDEIVGEHHRIFIDASERNSASYSQFWNELRSGNSFSNEFRRIRKNGESIWIRAM